MRPFVGHGVQWDEVEQGFHVATRRGEFLGFIETTARGTFVALDGFSTPVGRYDTLRQARRALLQTERMRNSQPGAFGEMVARRFATASGLIAVTMMLSAGTLLLPA
jgi:hypothetical protein